MVDLSNVLTLTQKELHDARRNRWFILFSVAFAGLALTLAWLALSGVGTYGLAGFGRTGASLINLVLLIIPLMGLTLGALSLAGERERGTLLFLLSQPLAQAELLLGKFVGLALAILAAVPAARGIRRLAPPAPYTRKRICQWQPLPTCGGVCAAIPKEPPSEALPRKKIAGRAG